MVVPCFCRDMSFVAFTRFFGLILMQTFMQTLRILCRYCADFCMKKCSLEPLQVGPSHTRFPFIASPRVCMCNTDILDVGK